MFSAELIKKVLYALIMYMIPSLWKCSLQSGNIGVKDLGQCN